MTILPPTGMPLCCPTTEIRALTMADLDSHTALTDWTDRPPGPAEADITTFNPVRRHITRGRGETRLCDGRAAGGADISTSNLEALRQSRAEATLCPVCQQNSGISPHILRPRRPSGGSRNLACLYTTPVLDDFDNIRNCPRCRKTPGDRTCRDWDEARKGVRVLHQEARRIAREVTDIPEATGGCTATIYEFLDGSVGYFAFGAPPWQEAGEITGSVREQALHVLESRGVPGGKATWTTGAARPNQGDLTGR